MIAAAVLFDERFTFGTILSVSRNPILSLGLILNLLLPIAYLITRCREMSFLLTVKTESMTTRASDNLTFHHLSGNSITTSLGRTPLETIIGINEGLRQKSEVFTEQLIGNKSLDRMLVNNNTAFVESASDSAKETLLYLR
jgi:hypothetical protein